MRHSEVPWLLHFGPILLANIAGSQTKCSSAMVTNENLTCKQTVLECENHILL